MKPGSRQSWATCNPVPEEVAVDDCSIRAVVFTRKFQVRENNWTWECDEVCLEYGNNDSMNVLRGLLSKEQPIIFGGVRFAASFTWQNIRQGTLRGSLRNWLVC